MFSYAPPLAVGDSSYYVAKSRRTNSDGTVRTSPKNFLTSPGKKGTVAGVYFSPPQYLSESVDLGARPKAPPREIPKRREKPPSVHTSNFKPAGPVRES
jgi:hypothetical protein